MRIQSQLFCDRGGPGPFVFGEMNIAAKIPQPYARSQLLIEILDEPPQKMQGRTVGVMDQWIMTINRADRGVLIERGEIGIVGPEIRARGAHVGPELARMTTMQITHGGGEH